MDIFKKREKTTENIAFTAIMAALSVGLFAILNFFTISFVVIILIFPVISFLEGYLCKKQYWLIYLLVTFLLCLTFSFYDISNLLFYLLPSLFVGYSIAVLTKRNISVYIQVLIATIVNVVFVLLSIPLIQTIYEINIIDDLIKMFGYQNYPYIDNIVLPFIIMMSFIQTVFSYLFIIILYKKLNISFNFNDSKSINNGGFAAIFGIFTLIFAFINTPKRLPLSLLLISTTFFIFSLINFKYKSWVEITMLSISIILGVIFFVTLYKIVPKPNQLCMFSITHIFYGIYYLINRQIYKD